MALQIPTAEDISTMSRVAQLLRAYQQLLQQSVSIQQEMSRILASQIAPPLAAVEREYVTETERRAEMAVPIPATIVSKVEQPITEKKPAYLKHYNQSTDATISKENQLLLQGTPLWMIVYNPDSTNSIAISFDEKKTYFKVPKSSSLNFTPFTLPDGLNHFWHKSDDAASIAFQILTGEY